MKPLVTKLPGIKSQKILERLSDINLGNSKPYPFVHSGNGNGIYFEDIDGNIFLDFSSQIASNPLGYNHKNLLNVLKKYSDKHPVKYAGQDFIIKEHLDMLEELLSIVPKGMDSAFLINSGAEAVENSIKIALRSQKKAKFGISFKSAFHGRTLGALSCTNSSNVQKKNYLSIPMKRLPFGEEAIAELERLIAQELTPEEIGFVIIEPIQGEGGYNVAPDTLMRYLRKFTKENSIPLICDEVQSGIGRTGKWFASEHYDITPDIMSSAKALQVGATISNSKYKPEFGSISSTWGGGHLLDIAIGIEIIRTIKEENLLKNIESNGNYLFKRLVELQKEDIVKNVRGKGLMLAFDLESNKKRNDFIMEALGNGLVLLGCAQLGIRLIPPYIISKEEIDKAIELIEVSCKKVSEKGFKHEGEIVEYLSCPNCHT